MKQDGFRIAAWVGVGLLFLAAFVEALTGSPKQALLLGVFLALAVMSL